MIYLPYSDDIHHIENLNMTANDLIPRASSGQKDRGCIYDEKVRIKR